MMLDLDAPQRDPAPEASASRRAVRLGRLGATRVSLDHAVFIAAAALTVVVGVAMQREGNGDLGRAAVFGAAFWVAGWAVQLLGVSSFAALAGLRVRSLSIGLLGVEISPHCWGPRRACGVALAGIGSLLLGALAIGVASPAEGVPRLWEVPSLGLAASDSPWTAGTWLWCFQAAAQLLPLPGTLGRMALVAVVSLLGTRFTPAARIMLVRRCVLVVAMASAAAAVALVPAVAADWHHAAWSLPSWLLTLVLAVMLWNSSRSSDLPEALGRLAEVDRSGVAADQTELFWEAYRRRAAQRRRQRRIAEALERERSEAVDATRLDEILQQLHRAGPDSISPSDRAVLQRVSRSLREHRTRQGGAPPE